MENVGGVLTLPPEQMFLYPRISTEVQNDKTNFYRLVVMMGEVVSR